MPVPPFPARLLPHGDHLFPITVVLLGATTLVATTMVLSPLLHGQRYPVAPVVQGPATTS